MEEWSVSGSKQTAPACFCWHWFKSSARSKTPHGCYKLSAPQTKLIFSFLLLLPSNLSSTFTSPCLLPANTAPSTFSYPHFHHVPLRSFFPFETEPSPSLFPNPPRCFPYPYHTFTTCQEDLGLCGFCPALGAVQLRLHRAGCRFGLQSRPGPTVRKWPLLWFKLAMRQHNRAFFCWRLTEERVGKVGRESTQPSANHMKVTGNWFKALPN